VRCPAPTMAPNFAHGSRPGHARMGARERLVRAIRKATGDRGKGQRRKHGAGTTQVRIAARRPCRDDSHFPWLSSHA
jgi:hypothetical protein